MPRKPANRTTRKPPKAPPAPEYPPPLRAKYFPTSPHVTEEIEAWAAREGVRVRAVVPIYWGGV